MFADAEAIQARLLGDHRLFDHVAEHARMRVEVAGLVTRHVAKGVDAKLEGEPVAAHVTTL
jgi:hypothetical protein